MKKKPTRLFHSMFHIHFTSVHKRIIIDYTWPICLDGAVTMSLIIFLSDLKILLTV